MKLFNKVAAIAVGVMLATGVGAGVVLGSKIQEVTPANAAGNVTATYTVTSTSAVSATGTAPTGSVATYSSTYGTMCQLTKGNSMTLTLSGYVGSIIKGLTLSMKSNSKGGAGNLSFKSGSNTIASISTAAFNTASWYGSWSTSYVDVTPTVTQTTVGTGEDLVITIAATANSLYCESFAITYEPASISTPTVTSVTVTPSANTVLPGESITAYAIVAKQNDSGNTLSNNVNWSASSNLVTISPATTASGSSNTVTITAGATEGEVTITAASAATGFADVKGTFTLTIIDGLASIKVTGDMTKKTYTTKESWDVSGLVVTATYESGDTEDVTSQATWTYDYNTPALMGVGSDQSLKCTAHYSKSGTSRTSYKTVTGIEVQAAPMTDARGLNGKTFYIAAMSDPLSYMADGGEGKAPVVTNSTASALEFTFTLVDDDTYAIKDSSNRYLYATDTNNGLRIGNTADSWTIANGSISSGSTSWEAIELWETSHTRQITMYDNTDFRSYTGGSNRNEDLQLIEVANYDIVSMSLSGSVAANTLSQEWDVSGVTVNATVSGQANPVNITEYCTIVVNDSIPTISSTTTTQVSVTATYDKDNTKTVTSDLQANLTLLDLSIQPLYSYNLGLNETQNNVTCDGIYMGYITHVSNSTTYYDLFIGNGDYGMEVYGTTTAPTSYTVGETYLTVTGTLKNYNYLYEMTNSTVSILTDAARKAEVQTPTTYIVDGSEDEDTLYLASRITSLSGVVKSINNNTTAGTTATANANNSIYVTVGGTDVLLYVKSAQAIDDVPSKFIVGQHITVEGFTTYFARNNAPIFEVLFETVVDVDENYHAADFARELLIMTKGLCNSSYDGVTNNGSALTSIWTTLAGADHWLKVEANGEDSTLINGTPDSTIVVPATDELIEAMSDADAIAAALYRYDYCTAKYSLTNFMSRTLTVSFSNRMAIMPTEASTAAAMVVVVVSAVSVTALGGFFLLKKKPF